MALCIACGMYYAAELAEEYTVLTKKILKSASFSRSLLSLPHFGTLDS